MTPDYYQTHKEERMEYAKKYRQENREKIRESNRVYSKKNRERIRKKTQLYREKNLEKITEKRIRTHNEIKQKVYLHYGKGKIECTCCGEKEIDFLSLDHIYNDGAEHRRKIGTSLMNWANNNNCPPIFQLLCMNCNCSKGKTRNNGKCMHEIQRFVAVV